MVKWDTITDDAPGPSWNSGIFSANYGDGGLWSSGVYTFQAGGGYSGIVTTGYDLIGSSVLFKMVRSVGGYSGATLKADASNVDILGFYYYSGGTKLSGHVMGANWSGSSTSADVGSWTASEVWCRFREDSGTVYVEYSTDGVNWTTIHSATATSSMLTALGDAKLQLEQGPFQNSLTSYATFDDINLPPASGTEIAHTGVAVEVTAAATTAPTALTVSHTGVAIEVGVAATTAPGALTISHGGVAVEVAVAGDTAPGALTVAHVGVSVEVAVAGDTAQAAGTTITHTGVVVEVGAAGDTAPGALTVEHAGVAVEVGAAGATAPGALTVEHGGVAIEVAVSGDTAPGALTVAHVGVAAQAVPVATTAPGALTISHMGVVIQVSVAGMSISLGNIVVTLVSGDGPYMAYDVGKPMAALSVGAPYLEP